MTTQPISYNIYRTVDDEIIDKSTSETYDHPAKAVDAARIAMQFDAERPAPRYASVTTYTTDPADVRQIVWYIPSEVIADYDETGEPREEDPRDRVAGDVTRYEARMYHVCQAIADQLEERYPNIATWTIANGGYENQFAPMSSTATTASGAEYEPFYDELTALEDAAITAAFLAYPTPGEEEGIA